MSRDLELIIRFRAEAAQAVAATNVMRRTVANFSSGVGGEIGKIQTRSKSAFTGIASDISVFTNRIPIANTAVRSLSTELDQLDQVRQRAGRGLSSLIGPAALVAAGAAISVVSNLTGKLFDLLEASSKLGGEIFDLTQKTGLGAERLTALRFATEQSGGSTEKLNTGIKNLALTISDANKGTDAAIARLKRLGIEPKQGIFDLDAALRKAMATIANAPPGIVQMTLAADAFGKKIGPELIPTIVSFDGNLDALTERARRLGVTLTDLEAKELDDFGDALDTLRLQAALLGAKFSAQVAPEITSALQRISTNVGQNKSVIEEWGKSTADVFRGLRVAAESDLGRLIGRLSEVAVHFNLVFLAFKGLRSLGAEDRSTDPSPDPFGPGGALRGGRKNLPGTPEFRASQEQRAQIEAFQRELAESQKGGGGAKRAADTELQKALRDAQLLERETRERIESDIAENKRALEQKARDIEEFTKRAIDLADQQLNATIDRVNAEFDAYKTALDKKKIARDEFNRKDRELTIQTQEAARKNNDEVFRLEAERDQKLSEAQIAGNQRSQQREEEAAQRIIERIKRRIELGIEIETEGERQIADIIDEGFRRRIQALKEEEAHVSTSAERKAFIADEVIRLDGERAGAAEQAANRIIDAIEREIQAERRYADELKEAQAVVKEIQLRIADETIRIMEANFASRRDIRRARRELELAEEQERHRLATESINRQKEEVDKEIDLLQKRIEALKIGTQEEIDQHERLIKSLETLRQKREQLDQQQQQENIFNQTRKRRITDAPDSDPFSGLSDAFDSLGKKAADVFGATEIAGQQFGQIMGQAFDSVAQGIGAVVSNYVLLGTTGPAALRKVLAVALATLAAEAAVKAVYWTAMGIADLFINPAKAANDFAAAALFASIAGVSAIAGRSVAGDLFKSKSTGGANSDSRDPGQINPITLGRNQAQPQQTTTQTIRHEHVIRVESNDSHIVEVFSKDFRAGGRTRELILNDGGPI